MNKIYIFLFLIITALSACTSLTLKPAKFAWPVEAVLKADANGVVEETRYSLSFSIKQIHLSEFNDSTNVEAKEIRILRNINGYYFITGEKFKNVYVFESDHGSLSLINKIHVSDNGLQKPALNQRPPYVELIDGNNKYELTSKGIKR